VSTSAIKLTRVNSKSIELNVRELLKCCSPAIERRAVAFFEIKVRFWDTHPSRLSIGWVWNYGPRPK